MIDSLITKHFDSNSDGTIDTGEWQSGMTASFTDMDHDNDGNLSEADVDELKGGLKEEAGEKTRRVGGVTWVHRA